MVHRIHTPVKTQREQEFSRPLLVISANYNTRERKLKYGSMYAHCTLPYSHAVGVSVCRVTVVE